MDVEFTLKVVGNGDTEEACREDARESASKMVDQGNWTKTKTISDPKTEVQKFPYMAYFFAAKRLFHEDGSLEFDESSSGSLVSIGDRQGRGVGEDREEGRWILIDELLSTDEGLRLYLQEQTILEVTELVCKLMDEQKVSRHELAKRIGQPKEYVDHFLDGRTGMSLRAVSDVFAALGRTIHFMEGPIVVAETPV
jgi:hypothetical protein